MGNFFVMGVFHALTKPTLWVHIFRLKQNFVCLDLKLSVLQNDTVIYFFIDLFHFFSRDVFGKTPELLQRLSDSSEENTATPDLLVALFYLPPQHLHEYGRLLLKLATCFEVVCRVDIKPFIHLNAVISPKLRADGPYLPEQRHLLVVTLSLCPQS